MNQSIFHNLTLVEEIITEIDLHDLSREERDELVDLVQKTLHHHTLATVLDHLPTEKHPEFLAKYKQDPENKQLLAWLKLEIKIDIEAAIKTQAAKIKKEILAEIKRAKISRR